MAFFAYLPKIEYDILGDNVKKLVPDIFRRIKIRNKIKDNFMLFDRYDVDSGDKPEDVAFKVYGSADLHWVVLLTNNIINPYYEWPLGDYAFQQFVYDKYSNPEQIHHYEVTQSSGTQKPEGPGDYWSNKIEVNSDYVGAEAVSNIEYERRLQDDKRQIKVLSPEYLQMFLNEYKKLIRR
jgi:hypothetical protein|tara:strand:- start:212 stop:751 length:540 start_codon:yes stop_codon:yes gene_type:complete